MAKVSYHPEPGAPADTEQFGYSFEKGKSVTIPDDSPHLGTLRQNQFFKVSGDDKQAKKAEQAQNERTDLGGSADDDARVGLTAEKKGKSWSIMRGGDVIKEGLSEEEAGRFNALSAEEKAEYIK